MPICPHCEVAVEYKNGMVCDQCTFDFKPYWLIPWSLLNLKFHRENRTPARLLGISAWMLLPTVIAIAIGRFLTDHGLQPTILFIFDIAVTIPISVVTFFRPLIAIFKNDNLRTDVHSVR